MPYVHPAIRAAYEPELGKLLRIITPDTRSGDLNYLITKILHKALGETSYTRANELVGVLECAKLELYRKKLNSYEDLKEKENGEVV